MAKELTPEEIMALQAELAANKEQVSKLEKELETATETNAGLVEKIEQLSIELASVKSENSSLTKVVDGVFVHNKKKYRFTQGHMQTRLTDPKLIAKFGEIVDSKELLENEELKSEMINLIKVGYGGIEEVTEE